MVLLSIPSLGQQLHGIHPSLLHLWLPHLKGLQECASGNPEKKLQCRVFEENDNGEK